ncbi:MAG: hypothetical protein CXZ00_13110 [Acidobacteria bacterium]|nr:MAG: hypothetical protein CXZ00_13110 [Acidobacteriota bacterium]
MNTLLFVLKSLMGGVVTLRLPKTVPTQPTFRGQVQLDKDLCIGCGRCAAACATKVIEVKRDRENKDIYRWSYDAAQCTFCGRCKDACNKFHALSMQTHRPPVYTAIGSLKQEYVMIRKRPETAAPKAAAAGSES